MDNEALHAPNPNLDQLPRIDNPGLQYLSPDRPVEDITILKGLSREGIEAVPADPAGRLEVEAGVIREEAAQYNPDSVIGQRLSMAAQVRETAVAHLDEHGGNTRHTVRGLKRERRQALKNGDHDTAANVQREIGVIERVRTHRWPQEAVDRLVHLGRDPQFAEKGLVRQLGAAAKNYALVIPSSVPATNRFTEVARATTKQHPLRPEVGHASDRERTMRSIEERHADAHGRLSSQRSATLAAPGVRRRTTMEAPGVRRLTAAEREAAIRSINERRN